MASSEYDVAVIGAGVVGCAIARRFALGGLDVVLIERGPDLLEGASKGNSALLHTGFDAPEGSLELVCMQAGYREYLELRAALNLPLVETGALVVAWNDDERARLPGIVHRAHANGVTDVRAIAPAVLYRREPALAPGALGAVLVPQEHVIDPWSAPYAYVLQAMAHGAQVRRDCEVTGGDYDGATWRLRTRGDTVRARTVVNAAGNHGDLVEAIARPTPFTIRPRKGQFVVFDKTAWPLVHSIILPVPNERTKGVLLARTAFGNVLVGPTAEDQDDRDQASVDSATLAMLVARAHALVPALAGHGVNAVYAGLRPASQHKDYCIEALAAQNWITVGGIRSTGLTAALGIAQYVAALFERHFGALRTDVAPIATPVPNLTETRERAYARAGSGEIVCHCELVTRAEIEAAFAGALPVQSVGGLRRRTRCMLGRCQGFYCSGRVLEIAGARLREFGATASS